LKLKKILFILPSLKAGGAERVLSFVAQNIDKTKFLSTLLVLGFEKDAVYEVKNVNIVYLNKKRLLNSLWAILKFIVRSKPNIVVSSIIHVNIFTGILAFFFRKIKFVAREASVISKMNEYSKNIILNNNIVLSIVYNNFSKIICQSKDMYNDIHNNYKISKEKLCVINNPITKKHSVKSIWNKSVELVNFITVGRLSKEKGHSRILENLTRIDSYNYHYTIIGDGPLKEELLLLVDSLGMNDKVTFVSYSSNVSLELTKKDVFLQGSYVEGFPNAVLESCVVGTAVIAFDAIGGTREIIKNGVNGIMVSSEEEFLNALKNISKILEMNPNVISAHVNDKFNSSYVLKQYEEMFNSII